MKTKRCFVLECCNDETTMDMSFYRPPASTSVAGKWLEFLERANSGNDNRVYSLQSIMICADHFKTDCFLPGKKRLKRGSIPTEVTISLNIHPLTQMSTPTEIVPRFLHPLGLWNTVIQLNVTISNYENRMASLMGQLEQQKARTKFYQNQLRVAIQKDQRRIVSFKRKAETSEESNKRIKTQCLSTQTDYNFVQLNEKTSSGKFLTEVHRRVSQPTRSYSDYLKQVAFQIHFHSPRAYDFIRTTLDNGLPHARTFREWTKSINTGPGILPDAIQFLKTQQSESHHTIYYALMFDEVHIRQQTLMDGNKMVGFVDYGGLAPEPEGDRKAKTALFFVLNQINGNKKLPVAYVLTDGLNKTVLAEMIKNVLIALHNANCRVLTITFDGLPTNFAAIEELGANLDVNSDAFNPSFFHPSSGEIIHVILDPCHMFKLIRNAWKSSGIFYDRFGKKIDWSYITRLNKLQEDSGLRAGNKMTGLHVNFETNKMKTKLCVQTISNSVGIAIRVCRELGQNGFADSEATEEFVCLLDRLFDLMNSRVNGKGYKSPITQFNHQITRGWLDKCRTYLSELQIMAGRGKRNITCTQKATGVRGLLITIASLQRILDTVVINTKEDLLYYPVYKSNQDNIELYFGLLRGRHGNNNNPNVLQVRYAVRDLLCIKIKDLVTGNACPQEDVSAAISPFHSMRTLVMLEDDSCNIQPENTEDVENVDLSAFNLDSKLFICNIVVYIAGFVVKKLCEKLNCAHCICKLCPSDEDLASFTSLEFMLLKCKNNGGLTIPTRNVIKICKYAESSVRYWEQKGLKVLSKDSIVSTANRECVNVGLVTLMNCNFVDFTSGHSTTMFNFGHGLDLIKDIVSEYTKIRLHHIAKCSTHMSKCKNNNNRSVCTKIVHFKGN